MKNVFKKNQLLIIVIALMLVTAGYLNYSGNGLNESKYASTIVYENVITNNNVIEENDINEYKEIEKNQVSNLENLNTIETSSVDVSKKNIDNYFVTSKLQRDTMYSQMIESYQKIIESPSVSAEQKAISTQEISKINNIKNAIMICENLLQTKGFGECVIFINDINISVIIKAEELTKEEIAQIQNIVARELQAEIENIHISNKE